MKLSNEKVLEWLAEEKEKHWKENVSTMRTNEEGKLVKHWLPKEYTRTGYDWLQGIARKEGAQQEHLEDIMQMVLLWACSKLSDRVNTYIEENITEEVTETLLRQVFAGFLKSNVKWQVKRYYQRVAPKVDFLPEQDNNRDSKQDSYLLQTELRQAIEEVIDRSRSKANKPLAKRICMMLMDRYTITEIGYMLGIERKQVYRGIKHLQRCLGMLDSVALYEGKKPAKKLEGYRVTLKQVKCYLLDSSRAKRATFIEGVKTWDIYQTLHEQAKELQRYMQ